MERSTFCVSLWRLCRQVDDTRVGAGGELQWRDVEQLLGEIRGLAFASRRAGGAAYGSLCLHIAERMEDIGKNGVLPKVALLWLDLWADRSLRYLDEPAAATAWALLEQLNDPLWSSHFSRTEAKLLLRALTQVDARRLRG